MPHTCSKRRVMAFAAYDIALKKETPLGRR